MIERFLRRQPTGRRDEGLSTASGPVLPIESSEIIRFRAFTATTIMTAQYEVRADRLTDALNSLEPIALTNVRFMALATLGERTAAHHVVPTMELLIVTVAGPRGNFKRRIRVIPHAVVLTIGPYRVEGTIHTVLGAHPTSGIHHRLPMVPITDAKVSYELLGRPIVEALDAIVINRNALSSIACASDLIAARMSALRTFTNVSEGVSIDDSSPTHIEPSRRSLVIVPDRASRTPAYVPSIGVYRRESRFPRRDSSPGPVSGRNRDE